MNKFLVLTESLRNVRMIVNSDHIISVTQLPNPNHTVLRMVDGSNHIIRKRFDKLLKEITHE